MYLAYYDESGDDGYPNYASPLFVLTSIYIHESDWRKAFDDIREFRRKLRDYCGLPVKIEIHAKYFLLNKKPYRQFDIPDEKRISAVTSLCKLLAFLPVQIVNVAIDKPAIMNKGVREYGVLNRCLNYSLQRVENDLTRNAAGNHFMMITDEGRVGKMRNVAREIRAYNYIPSMFSTGAYRRDSRLLIEDPVPKNSSESYFIQLCDVVAYIVYQHKLLELGRGSMPNRMPPEVNEDKLKKWLDLMGTSLNRRASRRDAYGIVTYPR